MPDFMKLLSGGIKKSEGNLIVARLFNLTADDNLAPN